MDIISTIFSGFFGILGGIFLSIVLVCIVVVVVGVVILRLTGPAANNDPPSTNATPSPTTAGAGATTPRGHGRVHIPSWVWWTLVVLVAVAILAIFNWEYVLVGLGMAQAVGIGKILTWLALLTVVGVVVWWIPSGLRDSAIAIAVIGLFGYGIYSWVSSWTWSSSYSTPMRIQNAAKSTRCPGELKTVELDAVPKVINPGGRCILHYKVEGAVVLIDATGNTLRVDEKPSNNPSFWPEYARSAQKGTVRMHYKLNTS